MKRYAWMLGVLALCLSTATGAYAQEQTGSIFGIVKDASGAVLPGATVEARSAALIGVRSTVTDEQGAYRFPGLPPGTYEINGTLPGFVTAKVADVRVELGKQLAVELSLKLAGVSESVSVTAESPIIDTKASATTASIDAKTIELIPKGRGLLSVLTQIPGANNESRNGGFSIDGASGSENRFIVDGVDRTNARTGTEKPISGTEVVVQDFIDTVQVKQSGYNAEYRAALGGVVNAVTKSGGNAFHALGAVYQTDNKWLGENRPTLRSVPSDASRSEYVLIPRDKKHQTDLALSLGGPILRDRAWFFVGTAPQFYPAERTVRWASPGTFPATQTFGTGDPNNIATNYNVSSVLPKGLRARFTGNNETQKGELTLPNIQPDGTSTTSAATFNPRSTVFTEQFQNAYSGIIDWTATNRTFVNATISYLSYGSHSAGGSFNPNTRRTFSTPNIGMAGVPADLQHVSGFNDGASTRFSVQDDYQRFNIDLSATRYAHFKGQHALKIGGLYERIGNFANLGDQAPNISLNWGSPYSSPNGFTRNGAFGYFEVSRIFTGGDIKETNLSFFAQDQWTVNNRLTLNYGLRLENEEIPSYNPNAPGVKFGWGDKIGPRAGFAYDFGGDGKTKMYGSYGIFYDTMKLEMPRGAWGGEKWISYYYTLDTPNWPSIDCSDGFGATCTGGTFIESINFRHTSNEPGSEIGQVDPNLKPTRKHEYTVGLDRELRAQMSFGIRYARKGWDETIDDIGVCTPDSQVCGEVYNIANPGKGIGKNPITFGGPFPSVPQVVNIYDGLEFVLRKRYSNRWTATSSLLISRLYGNYGGLASSDENGRTSPNVSRYYDSLFLSFTEKGTEAKGRLNSDRPVQFKLQGAYMTPWGTNVGLNFFAFSGLIQSSTVTFQGVPVYFKGRGDLGRTPMLNQTDLLVSHDFRLFGNTRVGVLANITNLFDQDTVTSLGTRAFRDALVIPAVAGHPANDVASAFFQPGGIDVIAIQTARQPNSGRVDPLYKLPNGYQGARSIRLGARITF
jgi:outer membrane receptor protein involved in Fe transport